MKKIYLILVVGFICLNQLQAKKIPGYFIANSNDTVNVTFNIPIRFFGKEPNYERLQWKIKYYDSGHTKQLLKPGMASEISFICNDKRIIMLSRKNNLGLVGSIFNDNSIVFLQLIKDGKLKLFKYFKTNNSPGMYNGSAGMMMGSYSYSVEKYIMQKDNGDLYKTHWLSFKNDMKYYFSDCPDLAKKIEDKVYRSDDIEQIVDEYNLTCK